MAEGTWGGSGDLNLPWETTPGGPVPTRFENVELSSGVVVLGALVPHPDTGRQEPVLVFRFSRGDGTFYLDRVLVAEERELLALSDLIRNATRAARKAAREANGGPTAT